MIEPLYVDLAIVDDDLVLGESNSPHRTTQRSVIAQDIRHLIRESGLHLQLVGLRNRWKIAQILTQIELLVETDDRLMPGTIFVQQPKPELIVVRADTREFNDDRL